MPTTDAQTVDLRAKEVNLIMYQGDDHGFTVTFPNTVVLTGTTAKWTIVDRAGATVLALQSGSGITLSGQVFTVTVTKAQSAAMVAERTMFHDFQWTDASNKDITVFGGSVVFSKQRTP